MRGRRPVITGAGAICSAGRGVPAVWDVLTRGGSALRPLTVLDSPRYQAHRVGEVDLTVAGLPGDRPGPRSDSLAWTAAREALQQAGLSTPATPGAPSGMGVLVGATVGGMDLSERLVARLLQGGRTGFGDFRYHACGGIADRLANRLNVRGPTLTLSTACSAGAFAIAMGAALVAHGETECVLAGGCDALCRLTLNGFGSLLLLDSAGCRPFDASRAGISLGEGAAFVVIETAEHARSRGAIALAEIAGYGASCDAWHPTAPHPEGRGAIEALRAALESAEFDPDTVDFLCAHGTGTPDNDLMEVRAFREVFRDRVPPFSSNKRCFGHTLAASGALNVVLSLHAIRSQTLPPSPGFETGDPALGLEPIRTATRTTVRRLLSNAFGFGGNNVVVALAATRSQAASASAGSSQLSSARPQRFPIVGCGAMGAGGGSIDAILARARSGGPAPVEYRLPEVLGGGCVPVLACREDLVEASGADRAMVRRLSAIQLQVLAAARQSANGCGDEVPPSRRCVAVGTALGSLSDTAAFVENMIQREERAPRPTHFAHSVHNALAAQVALQLEYRGPNATLTQRETSFECALWQAQQVLAEDRADVVLAGAADELHPYLLAAGLRWGWWPAVASDPGVADQAARSALQRSRLAGEGAAMFTLTRSPGAAAPLAWVSAVRLGRLSPDVRGRPDPSVEARWIASHLEAEGEPLRAQDVVLVNRPPNGPAETFRRQLGEALVGRVPASYQHLCGAFGSASAFGLVAAVALVRGELSPGDLGWEDPAIVPGTPVQRVVIYTWSPGGTKGLLCVTA